MIIFPAIDIKDGNCVRLFKGDFSTVEKVASDYLETAKSFEAAGAEWIHMVDLDGAKEGRPVNTKIYTDVAEKTNLKVELGGGIRSIQTIQEYLDMGITRVILGSVALKNPKLVCDAVEKFGIQLLDGLSTVTPGSTAKIKVKLILPIAMEVGTRFAIREGGRTVACGVVTKIPNATINSSFLMTVKDSFVITGRGVVNTADKHAKEGHADKGEQGRRKNLDRRCPHA